MSHRIDINFAITITTSIGGLIDCEIVDEIAHNSAEYYIKHYAKKLALSTEDVFIYDNADVDLIHEDYHYNVLDQGYRTNAVFSIMCTVQLSFKDKNHFNKTKLMFPDFAHSFSRGEVEFEFEE